MAVYVLTIKDARVKFGDAPTGGAAIDAATLDDYSCAVTEARITAAGNTIDVAATFCSPAGQTMAASSFTLEMNGLQDWGRDDGDESFSEFLFVNDAVRKAFALYLSGEEDPRAEGLVTVASGDFGGVAGETLVFTGSFPILGYPTIFDSAGVSLRPNGAPVAATGATAGSPGTWTPSGSTPPANAAGATSAAITASPAAAWTTGQYVQGSTAGAPGEMNWSGERVGRRTARVTDGYVA